MRKLPTDVLVEKVAAVAPSSVNICMLALRQARNDVRAMRAAKELVAAGYAVSIVDIECERIRPTEEEVLGISLKHLIVPSWQTARRFEPWFFLVAVQTFVRSVYRLIRMPADVYHAIELTALPACLIAAKLRCKPLIFEIYDLQFPIPDTSISFWNRSSWLVTKFHELVLPRCAGVIATSPLHVQEIRNRFHIKEVTLLRNVPWYRAVAKSDRLRHRLGLGSQIRIALFQGIIRRGRGLEKLVLAATHLEQNIVIVLMGGVERATLSMLEALIANEDVADRVKILPHVPYKELLDWTASADIGLSVLPSDYLLNAHTSLPNKVFEYLMAGLPVLSSPVEAVSEIISTYDVGRIAPSFQPEDIAETINAMLADREGLTRMHRNALKAAEELCWENEGQELIRLYRAILAK